jgi:hypothetical protein
MLPRFENSRNVEMKYGEKGRGSFLAWILVTFAQLRNSATMVAKMRPNR